MSDGVSRYREKLFSASFDTLTAFQDHVETEEQQEEAGSRYMESVQVQVLQRLAGGVSKLFECCKKYELAPNSWTGSRRSTTERYLSLETQQIDPRDFEARFVRLISVVL